MMENDGHGYIYVVLVNYGDYCLDFLYRRPHDFRLRFGNRRIKTWRKPALRDQPSHASASRTEHATNVPS
ncbi:MAG: hypothetical protein EBV34_08430 [Betaproteobacteria bacterium]|nr:hypothetical protein [Betaproteobacteria bacterium]